MEKKLLAEIIEVSEDLRHSISMEYTERITKGTEHLLSLVDALKALKST